VTFTVLDPVGFPPDSVFHEVLHTYIYIMGPQKRGLSDAAYEGLGDALARSLNATAKLNHSFTTYEKQKDLIQNIGLARKLISADPDWLQDEKYRDRVLEKLFDVLKNNKVLLSQFPKEVQEELSYTLLNVTPGATNLDIKRAYVTQSVAFHPAKGGDPIKHDNIKTALDVLNSRRDRGA
jgi:hypothetical protein